jgi:hypothetical protein
MRARERENNVRKRQPFERKKGYISTDLLQQNRKIEKINARSF